MRTFEAYVPIDFRITLEAADEIVAADKASYTSDFFLKGATAYKLNIPGVGAVSLEIVPLEEDDDDTPEVFEVNRTETIGKLGLIQADPWADNVMGTCLIPATHPAALVSQTERNAYAKRIEGDSDNPLRVAAANEVYAGLRDAEVRSARNRERHYPAKAPQPWGDVKGIVRGERHYEVGEDHDALVAAAKAGVGDIGLGSAADHYVEG